MNAPKKEKETFKIKTACMCHFIHFFIQNILCTLQIIFLFVNNKKITNTKYSIEENSSKESH